MRLPRDVSGEELARALHALGYETRPATRGKWTLTFEVCKQIPQLLDEWWQVSRQDVPQDVRINGVVPMDQPIPQADDVGPRDLAVVRPEVCADPARGFSHDLQQAYEREGEQPIQFQVASFAPRTKSRASVAESSMC